MIERINDPKDLRKLSIGELGELATEIRKEIVSVVSRNGGHLSSNLGAVELTLALHFVLDTPSDKIVWDVGHQTYAHKMITGRRDSFSTIRKHGGISGFPKPEESPYDVFGSGHSSTSISAALGIACARDINKERFRVAAVIGDGSLTSGVALEGLNQAGGLKKDMMVILNDNEMSISKNVGALSGYLTKLITNPDYNKLNQNFQELVQEIPVLGGRILDLGRKISEGLKGVLVPGVLFEEMGFRYFGPINGHDLGVLIDVLNKTRDMEGPRIIHVVTKKGRGYAPAEKDPDLFHGSGPFDPETGVPVPAPAQFPSFTKVFSQALIETARKDSRVAGITAAMSLGTGMADFAKEFPQRFFDVGIAEEHSLVFAAGLALQGLKPVVAIYSTFLQRAYDQVLHDICLQNLPVVIVAANSGIVGEDGPTHHGAFDISYLRHIPNIVIMSPMDEGELRHMLNTALSLRRPVAIRFPKSPGTGADIKEKLKLLEVGKAEIIKDGPDAVFLAAGVMANLCMKASEILAASGINTCVVNARFIKPLDAEMISGLAKTHKKFITVEENALDGGFGSAVMELLEKEGTGQSVSFKRIGLPDKFIEHGPRPVLLEKYGLSPEGIALTVKNWILK